MLPQLGKKKNKKKTTTNDQKKQRTLIYQLAKFGAPFFSLSRFIIVIVIPTHDSTYRFTTKAARKSIEIDRFDY